jgi:hypothetical protein
MQSEDILEQHLHHFILHFDPVYHHNVFLFENYYEFLVSHKSRSKIIQVKSIKIHINVSDTADQLSGTHRDC